MPDPYLDLAQNVGVAGVALFAVVKIYLATLKSQKERELIQERRDGQLSGAIERLSERIGENSATIREFREFLRARVP